MRLDETVPAGLRRALDVRDGGCRFPGCDRPPGWTEAHHVVPWTEGGPTRIDNLILLCERHHHAVHQHGYRIKYDGLDAHFFRPDGTEIRANPWAWPP